MLDVAQDSMKYSETFTEDVKELQMCCALYLRLKLQNASSMIKFNFDNKDCKDVVQQLLILMNDVKMSMYELSPAPVQRWADCRVD